MLAARDFAVVVAFLGVSASHRLARFAAPAYGQTSDLLPMLFVGVTPEVSRQIARDWDRRYRDGREWVYCVTAWRYGRTQDGDSVFVIEKMEITTSSRAAYEVTGFECRAPDGTERPVAHAHLTGDCSASRADATNVVASAAPFGLIVCGPQSWAGYSRRQYTLMQKGVWLDRQASRTPPP